ncbi:phosphoribosyltransferase [Bacillus safensis]|uniref:phosphoribosyltransferase n=1 Tax=Bacillus safensis TaxID=561879 RepID=UPI0020BF94C7|nr:phosphoribosyltransferase [Bacillus safensis]MCK8454652.1 phosphoribosyltransferase [Bacillus safensis]
MAKTIIFPRLTIFNESYEMYEGIEDLIKELNHCGHQVILITHSYESLIRMNQEVQNKFNVKCMYRNAVRKLIDKENAHEFIIVGSSDDDLYIAANKKILIINPGWSVKQDDKPNKYGVTMSSPKKLVKAIGIIENQNNWFFKLEVDEKTTVLALTSANSKNHDINSSEREVVEGFNRLLKRGSREYFNALYFHLISGVMKSSELRSVDLWGVFPSSGKIVNEEVEDLKDSCRYLTGRQINKPVLIRHTTVEKSHHTPNHVRLDVGCVKHFDSIILNPDVKVKNKVVCLIDDYLTNGTSFETARNILLNAGARKVILMAIGRYKRGEYGIYQKEVYKLEGNLSEPGYTYTLLSRQQEKGQYNLEAREELKQIYNILSN